ncbi:hypothetical protein BpHYR1_008063 [Brachionus plicatilis]|uniref:Uncharacterized protein n=1 Tax=Brachionus plicatilis TaxID=10195 RepID=A0A3M7T327_BRAPC|nr:hypothetical protein BpHYR1_008063 [Brachionus plicatilis]
MKDHYGLLKKLMTIVSSFSFNSHFAAICLGKFYLYLNILNVPSSLFRLIKKFKTSAEKHNQQSIHIQIRLAQSAESSNESRSCSMTRWRRAQTSIGN